MKLRYLLSLLLCLRLFAGEGGTVTGVVRYDGEPPEPKFHTIVEADKQADCKCKEVPTDKLVVDKATKGIRWAIIRIIGVKAPEPATPFPEVSIDQKGCRFDPHVVIVAPGANLTVLNPDAIGHNVHTTPLEETTNQGMNPFMAADQPTLVIKGAKYFVEPDLIQLECNIHGWMSGRIVVHDPRFAAITGADGKFEIKNVPPGKYEVLINHELGEQKATVEVKAGAAADVGEIKFPVKRK